MAESLVDACRLIMRSRETRIWGSHINRRTKRPDIIYRYGQYVDDRTPSKRIG